MITEGSLLEFERHATVDLVAAFDLVKCLPSDFVRDVLLRPAHLDLDYFPVTNEGRVLGVLSRAEFARGEADTRAVHEAMQAVTTEMIVGRSDPLISVIEDMGEGPEFRLVLEVGTIRGIVTLSDLGRLPARALIFARITRLEMLLAGFIRKKSGRDESSWMSTLSSGRREKVESNYQALKSKHQNLDRVSAAQFCDKRVAACRLGLVAPEPSADPREMLEAFERLRDQVAHAMSGFAGDEHARDTARTVRQLGLYIAALEQQLRA